MMNDLILVCPAFDSNYNNYSFDECNGISKEDHDFMKTEQRAITIEYHSINMHLAGYRPGYMII